MLALTSPAIRFAQERHHFTEYEALVPLLCRDEASAAEGLPSVNKALNEEVLYILPGIS